MASTHQHRDDQFMHRALELARQGLGKVEPNPMVGCVVVRTNEVVGEGWHRQFGGPHAEIEALQAAGDSARGAELFVTLEPCCHQGKTGPCTQALIEAGISRVVVGCKDPNPQVAGKGITQLREAGIEVVESESTAQAEALIAPFAKLMNTGRPWVIGKWAMTLDGKIATNTGNSQWISGEQSRATVHHLRGRVDAILVGRGTVDADDPLLTARPPGARTATRIILDTDASVDVESQLIRTTEQAPVLIAVGESAPTDRTQYLADAGAQTFVCTGKNRQERIGSLLDELGRRRMTNVLVEGGAEVLGTLFDMQAIDEVLVFIAPKLAGGSFGPIASEGVEKMVDAIHLAQVEYEQFGDDICASGRISWELD